MRTSYRGHEINVTRECEKLLAYSIFREADGFECVSGFTNDASTVPSYVDQLKHRVDAELAEADPWGERELEYGLN